MRVGFIGLGSQGGPMARRIVEGGYPTTLWARRPATLEAFADTDAKVAGSPAELAAASDLVCLCVIGDADIDELTDGEHGLLSAMQPGGSSRCTARCTPTPAENLPNGLRRSGFRSSMRRSAAAVARRPRAGCW